MPNYALQQTRRERRGCNLSPLCGLRWFIGLRTVGCPRLSAERRCAAGSAARANWLAAVCGFSFAERILRAIRPRCFGGQLTFGYRRQRAVPEW
jgi:hypothetical protein